MFGSIAQAIADVVVDLSPGKIIPTMFDKNVVPAVREAVKKFK